MKEFAIQRVSGREIQPFSKEDMEIIMEYATYQPIRCKGTGYKHPRSLKQLRTYWRCCNITAKNSREDESWNGWRTKNQVDFSCRVKCEFKKDDTVCFVVEKSGNVRAQYNYDSLSIANCNHPKATKYISEALNLMAKRLGLWDKDGNPDVKTLLQNTEQ